MLNALVRAVIGFFNGNPETMPESASTELRTDAKGALWVRLTGDGVTSGGLTAIGYVIPVDANGNVQPAGDNKARHGHVQITDGTNVVNMGAQTPALSLPVTGSLAAAGPSTVADSTTPGTFASMAAGPSGIRVQNTSASGSPNIRVAASADVSATRGVQIAPGQSEIFAVSNASLLGWAAESGTPSCGVSQA